MAQNSTVLIYFAAEACKEALPILLTIWPVSCVIKQHILFDVNKELREETGERKNSTKNEMNERKKRGREGYRINSILLTCDAMLSCRLLPSVWWKTLPLIFSVLLKVPVASSQTWESSYILHGVMSQTSLILADTNRRTQVSNFKMAAFSLLLIGDPSIFNTFSPCTHVQADLHINIQVNPTWR